ncbi:vacuolar protein sorting-associated protein 26 [Metschnikowia bicuspidata var. bicuspidata NRRL YB-4993]|uniref:Vacuolar protein sorting-associated protein 26 n=1 Tax=Metschnikowia bicuspidata var. bicuspidata NRRL YB-4993 TaxID=869754 RepID=A0A1A0HJ98_9ASCO|nr:vacuolar protein sorting-associated protein 26 [Metschnikowia bicuspidata var. bicuspidata NRRL YB-4993]OBA24090.1 vacuolar protein sorting-associated protein 26 [Metschnikowia bicuspidata var. bicuspidata NRRL YB-4993]
MSLFFKTPIDIEIRLDGESARRHVDVRSAQGRMDSLPLYADGESVKGEVSVRTREGKRLEHVGIKVQLLGSIALSLDVVSSSDFLSLATELAAPDTLARAETYPFEFKNVEKPHESYRGLNVSLRYYLRVVVSRRNKAEITRDKELWVHQYSAPAPQTGPQLPTVKTGPQLQTLLTVKMDVGIEHCLHIEFEYLKSRFLLNEVLVGRIYFLLVRLKIKHMEISLIRRESVGSAPKQVVHSETLVKFEIMDGAPVKGESIPIRLFLGGYNLTPTYKDVNKKFSTRTYLSLVLIDEDGRRYFKQSEIVLYREE